MKKRIPINKLSRSDISWSQEASFWSLVDIRWIPDDSCWPWMGHTQNGYGRFKIGNKRYAATRVMYAIVHGPVGLDDYMCHICDNKICVRPDHFYAGNAQTNMKDRDERGQLKIGEECNLAKLREKDVVNILKDNRSARLIAKDFCVSKSTIQKIKQRVNWKHVNTD